MVSLEDTNTTFSIFTNMMALEEVRFVLEQDLLYLQRKAGIFNLIEFMLAKLDEQVISDI